LEQGLSTQCSSATTRSGAERQQRGNGEGCRAAAPAQPCTEERRGRQGSCPQLPRRSDQAGPARGQRLRHSPAKRQQRQSGYVVERRHSPSWGRQCSPATTRIGAGRQKRRDGESGGAAAPAQRPGGPIPGGSSSGSESARRIDSDDSRGAWSNGDTPPPGSDSARRQPPAVKRGGSGRGTARAAAVAPAQKPGGPSLRAAALAQPGEAAVTTVGVRGRTETLPPPGAGSARRRPPASELELAPLEYILHSLMLLLLDLYILVVLFSHQYKL
jgi:hypothetical protein